MAFETSPDAIAIKAVLRGIAVGGIATYEEISKAIGRDVRAHAYPALNSARRSLQSTEGIYFATENNVGFRRLDDIQLVESTEKDLKKIKKTTKAALAKLQTVDTENLTPEAKGKLLTKSAHLGAIYVCSETKTQNLIEKKFANQSAIPNVGDVLNLLTEKK